MKLSPHFQLAEFTRSQTALRKGIANEPSSEVIANLRKLCVYTLEPIRLVFGQPLAITSGFRCPALNKAIGGSKNSQHVIGQAADFFIPGVSLRTIYDTIKRRKLDYDQLIFEGDWIHVSFRQQQQRRQSLIAHFEGKRVHYELD